MTDRVQLPLKTALALTALLATAPPVMAQVCSDTITVYSALKEQYGETRRGMGFTPEGAVVEFWTSESGTWSALVTTPDGKSCVVVTGVDWAYEPEEKGPKL